MDNSVYIRHGRYVFQQIREPVCSVQNLLSPALAGELLGHEGGGSQALMAANGSSYNPASGQCGRSEPRTRSLWQGLTSLPLTHLITCQGVAPEWPTEWRPV